MLLLLLLCDSKEEADEEEEVKGVAHSLTLPLPFVSRERGGKVEKKEKLDFKERSRFHEYLCHFTRLLFQYPKVRGQSLNDDLAE